MPRGIRLLGPGRIDDPAAEYRLLGLERRETFVGGHTGRVEWCLVLSLVPCAWGWWRVWEEWTLIVLGVRLQFRRH